jgi:hypothetical protein
MKAFDATVVLQVSDETTLKRLSRRLPGEFGAKKETRDWVLSWKHRVESDWLAAGAVGVSAEPEPDTVARNIASLYNAAGALA